MQIINLFFEQLGILDLFLPFGIALDLLCLVLCALAQSFLEEVLLFRGS